MQDEFDLLEPFPDVHALFQHYAGLYFADPPGCLGACSVEWSTSRMTLCAGVCRYLPGGGCRITLSEPLLKFRPVKELKETLLHEMIHAYVFLNRVKDSGDHGPMFQQRMRAINTATFPDHQRPPGGYNITVYHTMHDEVNNYRRHVWKCERCDSIVRRAMNRPPQEADCRGRMGRGEACRDPQCGYHKHCRTCGGAYIKVAEPEGYGAKKTRGAKGSAGGGSGNVTGPAKRPKLPQNRGPNIMDFFHPKGGATDGGAAASNAIGGGTGDGAGVGNAAGCGGGGGGGGQAPSAGGSGIIGGGRVGSDGAERGTRGGGGGGDAAVSGQARVEEMVRRAGRAGGDAAVSRQAVVPTPAAEDRAEMRRVLAAAVLRRQEGATSSQAKPHDAAAAPAGIGPAPAAEAAVAGLARGGRTSGTGAALPSLGQGSRGRSPDSVSTAGGCNTATAAAAAASVGTRRGTPPASAAQVEVIDLVEGDASPPVWPRSAATASSGVQVGGGGGGKGRGKGREHDDGCGSGSGGGASTHLQVSSPTEAVCCPLCGERWGQGALDNLALNTHIDECLRRQAAVH